MAGKQAKVLSIAQERAVLAAVAHGKHPERDRVMVLLSLKAGFRAREIALATWSMAMNSEGGICDAITIENRIAKRGRGRTVPLSQDLVAALKTLHAARSPNPTDHIIYGTRAPGLSPNAVARWFLDLYQALGFIGASSHSGRRTFITRAARRCVEVGGSLRDVQEMAGHASLTMTQAYIDGSAEAKRKLVNLI